MKPISLLIVVGIIVIYLIVDNVKFNKNYHTLMKQKEERESKYPIDNNESIDYISDDDIDDDIFYDEMDF